MTYEMFFGLFLGLLAYSFLYLAKGIEKYAIEGIKKTKTLKSKSSLIWVFGVSLNALYMFMQWVALKYSPISLIAPLNGIGLIVFMIFSFYVLKEKIMKIELVGVVLIICGTIIISIFNSNNSMIKPDDFSLDAYLLFLATVIILEVVLVIVSRIKGFKFTGIIVGLTAGTFFAFETVSKRVTALPDGNIKVIFSILTMIIAFIGFIFTQYALVKEKANMAVPCFMSTSVIFATVIGTVFLNEKLNLWSVLGIVIILTGIVLLTAFKGHSPAKGYLKLKKLNYI